MDRRWLIGGLAASLAVNLFLAGTLSVVLLRKPAKALGSRATALAAAEYLDPEHRRAYRQMIKREGRAAHPLFREAKAARREAAALFGRDPYDQAAVAAALNRSRTLETRARAQLETAMLDFARPLSARERSALAVTLRRGLGVKRHGDRGGRGARRDDQAARLSLMPPRRPYLQGPSADAGAG